MPYWNDPPDFDDFIPQQPFFDWEDDPYIGQHTPTPFRQSMRFMRRSDIRTTEDALLYGMEMGLPRDAIQAQIKTGMMSGQVPTQGPGRPKAAADYLYQQNVPGYEDYLRKVPEGDAPISLSQWRDYPSHLRHRMTHGLPVSGLDKDDFGRPVVPEGYIRRKDSAVAFPQTSITHASHLAREGDTTYSTYQASKLGKRIQMGGAHEQTFFTGLPTHRGPLQAGPESPGADRFQTVRGAYILGGEIEGAGEGWIDPKAFGRAQTHRAYDVYPQEGQAFDWMASKGTSWKSGENVQLASGMTGFRDKWWDTRVADVQPFEREGRTGYRYLLERSADPALIRAQAKHGATKLSLSPRDLSGITDVRGQSLGLQMVGGLKDPQGAAYEHFMAQDRAGLAKMLGYGGPDQLPGSYSELGRGAMQAFGGVIDSMKTQIRVPLTIHESQLDKYRPVLAGDPKVMGQDSFGANIYQGTGEYTALVGDFAKQFTRGYGVKRVFLNTTELERLRSQQPKVYSQVMKASGPQRQAYGNMIAAATGRELPYKQMSGEQLGGFYGQGVEAARAQLGIQDLSRIDPKIIAGETIKAMKQSEFGRSPLEITAHGQTIRTPSPQNLAYFGASDEYLGQEASGLVNAFTRMAGAAGSPGDFKEAASRFTAYQQEVAGGRQSVRRATGAFVPKAMAQGDVVRGSAALAPREAVVPGQKPGLYSAFGFPTQGEASWNPDMWTYNIGAEEAAKRGLDPRLMQVSPDLAQAHARDFDQDLLYMMRQGDVKTQNGQLIGPNGKPLMGPGDTPMSINDPILRQGQTAIQQGAGNLREEMVGWSGQTSAQAFQRVKGTLQSPHAMTDEAIQQHIGELTSRYQDIGPYYNTFMRARALTGNQDRAGVQALEKLWNISHNTAQRPAQLPAGMQHLQDLASFKFETNAVYQRELGKPGQLPQRGLPGLMTEATRGLMGSGVSPDEFAALMAPEQHRGAVAKLVSQSSGDVAAISSGMQGILKTDQHTGAQSWAASSTLGQFYGGQAVHKFLRRGGDISQLAEHGVPERLAMTLRAAGNRSEAAVQVARKKRRTDMGELGDVMRQAEDLGLVTPRVAGTEGPAGNPVYADRFQAQLANKEYGAAAQEILDANAGVTQRLSRANADLAGAVEVPTARVTASNLPLSSQEQHQEIAGPRAQAAAPVQAPVASTLHYAGPPADAAERMAAMPTGYLERYDRAHRAQLAQSGGRGLSGSGNGGSVGGGMPPGLPPGTPAAASGPPSGPPGGSQNPEEYRMTHSYDAHGRQIKSWVQKTPMERAEASDRKLLAYDKLIGRLSGGESIDDPHIMRMAQKAGLSQATMTKFGQAAPIFQGGEATEQAYKAAMGVSFEYADQLKAFEEAGGMDLAVQERKGKLGAYMERVHGAGGQMRSGREQEQVAALQKLDKNLQDASQYTGDFASAMQKATKTVRETDDFLAKDFKGSLEDQVEALGQAKGDIQAKQRRLKRHLDEFGPIAAAAEKQGVADDPRFKGVVRDVRRAEEQQVQLRRRASRLSDMEDDLTPQMAQHGKRQAGGYRTMGRIFGLSMLPWQLQFAKMWGTQQAEEAFEYGANVDRSLAQATYAGGVMPPDMGTAALANERAANQGWGQYFKGQGAAGAMGDKAFWAKNPAAARGMGAAQHYGQFVGYGLAAELVANQSLGRGMMIGNDPFMRGSGVLNKAAGLGMVAGVGVLGVNAAVDVANAVQDRTRTTMEGVHETGRNAARIMGGAQAWIAGGVEKIGDATGLEFLSSSARALQEGIATNEDLVEPTESEIRDAARKRSPGYIRQQAIMEAMRDTGIAPEQAGAYAVSYAQAGITDPQKMAKMAGKDFQIEQFSGLQTGQLIQTISGLAKAAGSLPGQNQELIDTIRKDLTGIAETQPQQFAGYFQGIQQSAQQWGTRPQWAGLGGQDTYDLYQETARMNTWDRGRYIQDTMLTTPRAWSKHMRQEGFDDMALTDELGRPANYGDQRNLELAQRDWGKRKAIFGLEQGREQLTYQRDWMERGWELEDRITPLRQRYRVEDADMGIEQLQLRLDQAQGEDGRSRFDMQKDLFEKNIEWKEADIATSGARAQTQFDWQMGDISRSRQQFTTKLGWQMEDINEAIRFASGRDRRHLIEQRERMTIEAGWQRREFSEQEERAETQYEWGEEDRATSLERLNEESDIRREMMDQDEEANKRSLELMEKQLQMAIERREELVNQIIPAEQEQEKLQREQQEMGLHWREERQSMDEQYFAAIQPLQEALTASTDKMREAWAAWQTVMETGLPEAADIFLRNFGEDSAAFQAMKKWQEMLKGIGDMGGGSVTGAADSQLTRYMEQQMPTFTLR